jgi:Tol biopolymer transport system component
MNGELDFQLRMRDHLRAQADTSLVPGQLDDVFTVTSKTSQRGRWRALTGTLTRDVWLDLPRPSRAAVLLAALALLIATMAVIYLVGSHPRPRPPFNGLILFGRFEDAAGDTVVYTIHPDGTGLHRVRPEPHEMPHWSPDGQRILLGESVVSVDGTVLQTYSYGSGTFHIECPYLSPDETRLLCEGFDDNPVTDASVHGIYSARASDGGDVRRITALGSSGTPAGYSPDGRTILFITGAAGQAAGSAFLVDADGSNQRQLGTLSIHDASWAPDGTSVLMTSERRLYRVDVSTGLAEEIRVDSFPDGQIVGAVWSPDQTKLLIKRLTTQTDLYVANADGSNVRQLTNDANDDRWIDWGIHPLDP